MTLNYDNLWKMLIDRKMTKTQMRNSAGISTVTLAKMSKGEAVGPYVLEKICKAMKCDASEIVKYAPDGPLNR
ncbi:MAG: helix-turn-helix transcriptional regulator [Kiritimatiellae bacterium]|nr:helix-turn-helix transcriptional regulator [Kiritimatiellia bacterium]